MTTATPSARAADPAAQAPAQLAKAALRRLAMARLEPTPENYSRAYAEEAGGARPPLLPSRARDLLEKTLARIGDDAASRGTFVQALNESRWDDFERAGERLAADAGVQAQAWTQTVEKLARGLERGSRQWTAARKKESLQRVLESSGSDLQRLQHRLRQLIASWDAAPDESPGVDASDSPSEAAAADDAAPSPDAAASPAAAVSDAVEAPSSKGASSAAADGRETPPEAWPPVVSSLESTVRVALGRGDDGAGALADELGRLADAIAAGGPTPAIALEVEASCGRARRWLAHRHHLLDELGALCRELASGLGELAEDDSWARGQCESLTARLADGLNARSVRAAADLLAKTRERQRGLRGERDRARDALKALIRSLLDELSQLDEQTGRFETQLGRYSSVIEQADSLDSLAGAVREMVDESRAVHARIGDSRRRLHDDESQARGLESRVRELESELRQLSDEVSTDALTQVANRRGLLQAFDAERSRLERDPADLGVALIDIDNFKRLNDSLGHAAGDEALRSLAARVKEGLRPGDSLARYGGEEFVLLLPGTACEEAQRTLTRLQRSLSASLFMHDAKEVLVTFSAGVTAYRPGEALESALQRADEALYEAKRTGKNRTCIG